MAAEAENLITEDEAVANCVLLLFAGHETTANLIANGLVLLFDNPPPATAISASAWAPTTAWAPPWPAWKPTSAYASCWPAAPASVPPTRPPPWQPTPPFGHRLTSLPVTF
ncbi:hypothetical protein AB0J83_05925 [Actinoplanes sp. NPDC049596]|uniref:hypothetical protein n=1 Tax=unclassified Actinoplanes TaxID=2626549 RepID=UPI00342D3BE8